MRKFNHWSAEYIFNRINFYLHQKAYPKDPWLTKNSISIIKSLIRESDNGLEIGSGKSTKWFLERSATLKSVEASRIWYDKISEVCYEEINSGRLTYILSSSDIEYKNLIKGLDDNSLDYCLIDGLFRDICAAEILQKLKPGAVLIIDNIERYIPCSHSKSPNARKDQDGAVNELWSAFLSETKNWRYIWTTNGVNDTGIWIKTIS